MHFRQVLRDLGVTSASAPASSESSSESSSEVSEVEVVDSQADLEASCWKKACRPKIASEKTAIFGTKVGFFASTRPSLVLFD